MMSHWPPLAGSTTTPPFVIYALAAAWAVCSTPGPAEPPPAVATLRLAENSATEYAIVTGNHPTAAERTAARELIDYLQKVTGAAFQVVEENSENRPAKAIFVGRTAQAGAYGIECDELGPEEWAIEAFGDDLVITGGRPRGTLYGVYEFLEGDIGVHWLDHQTEVVPERPSLTLTPRARRDKPAFQIRNDYPTRLEKNELRFRVRNRQNYFGATVGDLPTDFFAAYGGREYIGGPYHCHNLHLYLPSQKYLREHPEYFAKDKSGHPVPPLSEAPGGNKVQADFDRAAVTGGLCLTNPEVRTIILRSLLDRIAADRRAFPPGQPVSPDQPPPTIYDVSQQDNHVVCHCATCRALVDREGSESGPLIDFINTLADGVRRHYPEIKLQTFAYQWSQIPPKTLRPRENVVIRWCDWYATQGEQKSPEPWHPLTSPINAWRADNLRQWSAITPAGLHIWDYGEPFAWPGFPFTLVPTLADDINLFADNRAFAIFLQGGGTRPWAAAGLYGSAPCHFSSLYHWLACQLMLDPRRPVRPLIDTFMDGYYGPAAPTMRALYSKLETAQLALPARNGQRNSIASIDYVTPAFYQDVDTLLQAAEAACLPGSRDLIHVQWERLRNDSAILHAWRRLAWKLAHGAAMPFDRDELIARIEKLGPPVLKSLGYGEASLRKLAEQIAIWRVPSSPPSADLPDRFRGIPADRIRQFLSPDFYGNAIVTDAAAAGGKALRLRDTGMQAHDSPPVFGLYDENRKEYGPILRIAKEDIPQDGMFHLYKVGRWRILPGTRLWGHKSWVVSCLELETAYSPPGPDAPPNANEWDVWVSAKFTGPAYIHGSTDTENGYFMDRVILVKPDDAPPPRDRDPAP